MWMLIPLLAAIGLSYAFIRRLRLVRERKQREESKVHVEEVFHKISAEFSVPAARDLLQAIQTGKHLRLKHLQPELSRLQSSLSTASQWTYGADPDAERTAVLNCVAHLFVKWRNAQESV
jgi:cell division GTPase FtsZ